MEISSPKIWAISVIFTKLPKVNNDPIGENSPDLVTLNVTYSAQKKSQGISDGSVNEGDV
jgi:hypothetical protein